MRWDSGSESRKRRKRHASGPGNGSVASSYSNQTQASMNIQSPLKCIAATALVAGLALASFLPQGQSQESGAKVQKWEYRVLRIEDRRQSNTSGTRARGSASEEKLNELGAEGWELISVRNDGTSQPVFYFKRPKN